MFKTFQWPSKIIIKRIDQQYHWINLNEWLLLSEVDNRAANRSILLSFTSNPHFWKEHAIKERFYTIGANIRIIVLQFALSLSLIGKNSGSIDIQNSTFNIGCHISIVIKCTFLNREFIKKLMNKFSFKKWTLWKKMILKTYCII